MYTFECMVLTTIINEVDMQVRIVLLLKRSDGTDDVYFLIITRYDDRNCWCCGSINRSIMTSVLRPLLSYHQYIHKYQAHHSQGKEDKEKSCEEV